MESKVPKYRGMGSTLFATRVSCSFCKFIPPRPVHPHWSRSCSMWDHLKSPFKGRRTRGRSQGGTQREGWMEAVINSTSGVSNSDTQWGQKVELGQSCGPTMDLLGTSSCSYNSGPFPHGPKRVVLQPEYGTSEAYYYPVNNVILCYMQN